MGRYVGTVVGAKLGASESRIIVIVVILVYTTMSHAKNI